MRNELYLFRHSMRLTQKEMAEKIGCGRHMYYLIESGKRDGSMKLWNTLQNVFSLSDAQKGILMKNETTND